MRSPDGVTIVSRPTSRQVRMRIRKNRTQPRIEAACGSVKAGVVVLSLFENILRLS
jgi:hypothetical protein